MPSRSALAAVSLLFGSVLGCALHEQVDLSNPEPIQEVLDGEGLTAEQAGSLEEQLAEDPGNIAKRTRLIEYYALQFGNDRARDRRREHVLWLVRNAPEAAVLAWGYPLLYDLANPVLSEQVSAAWSRHVEDDPNNVSILRHAAKFHEFNNPELAITLLERGQSLDESNPLWSRELGTLHWLESDPSGESEPEASRRALAHFERAYELSDGLERELLLPMLAMIAFTVGELEKAREHAESMLQGDRQSLEAGDRVHIGHITLGRIALRDGDLEDAKSRLIAACEVPASAGLEVSSPRMSLAQDLLELGESQIVLRYFSLCSKPWERGQETLRAWTAIVEKGGIPDFSGNSLF